MRDGAIDHLFDWQTMKRTEQWNKSFFNNAIIEIVCGFQASGVWIVGSDF